MIKITYEWKGKIVRNANGKTGVIVAEDIAYPFHDLYIDCSDGTKSHVILCAKSIDKGDVGWQWWCPEFDLGPAWLPLGNRGAKTEYAQNIKLES